MSTERVTYRPEGQRARTIYLDKVSESTVAGAPVLTGVEVDREGSEVYGKGFEERHHIIEVALIVRRVPVVMSNIYGEFEEVAR